MSIEDLIMSLFGEESLNIDDSKIILRQATESDYSEVKRMYVTFENEQLKFVPKILVKYYGDDGFSGGDTLKKSTISKYIHIIEYDGVVIGFIKMVSDINDRNKIKSVIIKDLFIKNTYRGGGVGTAAIEYCKSVAKSDGAKIMMIGASKANKRAISLYSKLGFETYHEGMVFEVK